jgi:hypothetical protein
MRKILLAAAALCLAGATDAATLYGPSGIVPVAGDASANWKMAGMLSAGGIPARTAICATLSPSGGDDSDAINAAIETCPINQVVMLRAGTFTIAEGNFVLIDRAVTLRGAGPGSTLLTRTGGATLGSYFPGNNPSPMVIIGPQEFGSTQHATALTADGTQGATSIQVANAAGLTVGKIVMIDEASGAKYVTDPEGYGKIWAAADFRVVWQKHNPPQGFDDFAANEYPYTAGSTGCYFSNCNRPTAEMHRIAAVSGTTVTFDSPLTISYRVSNKAQVHRFATAFTENAGLEDMSIQHGDAANVLFNLAAYSWAKNVESDLWLNGGFVLADGFRDQLEGVWSHNAVWPVPGGAGYAIDLQFASSEDLVENSITDQVNKVIVVRSAGAGCVVAYNYFDDGYINGEEAWQEIGINASHATGTHHTLFEGNWGFNIDSDDTHGNSTYLTFFRNYASGYRRKFTSLGHVVTDDINNLPGNNGPLRAAGAMAYSYWQNWIGNVLGTAGHTAGWTLNGSFSAGTPGIWLLGWYDQSPYKIDPKVTSTGDQNGNYDFVSNAVAWNANDTTHMLPNSLYLSQKPAFFNAGKGYIWPWVNPTASPQLDMLPAKARYDAGTPFVQP